MLSPEHPLAAPQGLFADMLGRIAWLALGGALAGGLLAAIAGPSTELPKFFLVVQDAPALFLIALFLLAARRLLAGGATLPLAGSIDRLEGWNGAVIVAALAACLTYAGAHLVYRHFALSVDEFMADFDARIIAGGHLLASVAPEWRDYVPALQPIFRLAVPENAFWASSYLPVNAAIRAAFLLLGDAAIASALFAGIALLALFGIARHLWPDRPDAAMVAVLLLACSSQFLITAMTPYAMTAHLALNLIWLWLFLRDTRWSHALAAATGFAACGLHQVIFHPLFVAPFLLTVLLHRKWKLAGFYAAAYAAIGLFWILYWSLLLPGTAEAASSGLGLAYQLKRIGEMVQLDVFAAISYMGLNIFRFIAWQAPLTIPLAFVGFLVCRRQSTTIRDLAFGIFLTLAVITVLMPYQGHGWGYRYLHGMLGSLSLLAAQGWICLSEQISAERRKSLFAAGLALSLLVIVPWHAFQASRFVTPYASASAAIARSDAQVVLVDSVDVWFGTDLVRNDPYLRKTPKVMTLGYLDEVGVRKICGSYDVAVFDRRDANQFGLREEQTAARSPQAAQHIGALRQVMASINCGRPMSRSRP